MAPDRRRKHSRPHSQNQQALPLSIDQIQYGDIHLLPSKEECQQNHPDTVAELNIEYGRYKHLILVFAVHRQKGDVLALIVSGDSHRGRVPDRC